MKHEALKKARLERRWTQAQAAARLQVSQTYLSMLEAGKRDLSLRFARKAVRVYGLPPTLLPPDEPFAGPQPPDPQALAEELASLGYPGLAYLRRRGRRAGNPAVVLVSALGTENLEARLTEALPWVLLKYGTDLDLAWLVRQARLHNLQNRLGFVVGLALARGKQDARHERTARTLEKLQEALRPSRRADEDTLCQAALPREERRWLAATRPAEAAYWNLLTDWRPEHLRYVE